MTVSIIDDRGTHYCLDKLPCLRQGCVDFSVSVDGRLAGDISWEPGRKIGVRQGGVFEKKIPHQDEYHFLMEKCLF